MTREADADGRRHTSDPESIRIWADAIAGKAGDGYRVEREPNPPYGWNLFDHAGALVCSGSLDRLELWVLRRNTQAPDCPAADG